ncbi:MAG: hypothetical protein ACO25L_06240 [Candidatus Nanopelagicales bacterium]
MAKEKITIQIDDQIIELKGTELDAFLEQRAKDQAEEQKRQEELQAQKELKISAYKKLGLTDEEINAII